MNSPYTKHLDATRDHNSHSTAVAVPTYAAAPMQAPAPVIVHSGADSSGGGGKAAMALIAIVLAAIACVAGYAIGHGTNFSKQELDRWSALSGREGEIRGRDAGWKQGRDQGRTEMQFLAKYEQLRTQATSFNQGYTQGRSIGKQMGQDQYKYRYNRNAGYGYGGRGYNNNRRYSGYGYGGSVGNAVASAQNIANMTGQPVDVIVN